MGYLVLLERGLKVEQIGQKASQLIFLQNQRVNVPASWVVTWRAFLDWQKDKTAVFQKLRSEIETVLDSKRPFAVRSSANVEDGDAFSFAGQFQSILNVNGVEALLNAIEQVWQSAKSEALRPYLTQAGIGHDDIKMAVILQEMVEPVASGVAFSKNPMTGMDEIIVEAVAGSGEALVQEGVTPHRWVYKWGEWLHKPEHMLLPKPQIEHLIDETKRLSAMYGAPVDLEWVWNGTAVYWVQIREITTLNNLTVYSNRISREVMPGIIKPLIWSINVPLVNTAWVKLIRELIGEHDIQPEDLAHAFHYRSYFNMSTLGRVFTTLGMPTETLELMMGLSGGKEKPRFKPSRQTYKHFPRLLRFLLDKLLFARKVDAFLPKAEAKYEQFALKELSTLSRNALILEIDELFEFTQQMAYVSVVGPLLMLVHNNRLHSQLKQRSLDYATFDLMHQSLELEKYDPSIHLDRLTVQLAQLPVLAQEKLEARQFVDFLTMPEVAPFREQLVQFSRRFGHFSDSGNDFSKQTWRELPNFLLQIVVNYERGETAVRKTSWSELPLSRFERWRLSGSYRRARRWRLYRERISFNYTFGYGLFRNLFLELARRFVEDGLIHERDDIFYLYYDEIKRLVADPLVTSEWNERIAKRRQEIEAVQDAVLPEIIYGDDAPPLETAVSSQSTLKGIATSRGYYQGRICVIQSVQKFNKMESGAVLVIPYSDVSWTPLFAKAGAVIAESGGMLSHSSIVAREFGLPAVVSVTNACRLLQDGVEVTVDGYSGVVKILDNLKQRK